MVDVSKKVLTIGSEYQDHRGGIGAVLESYSKYLAPFKFVASYDRENPSKWYMIKFFLKSVRKIKRTLQADKEIEIVHIHGAAKGSVFRKYVVFLLCSKVFHKKVIFHCHGSEMKKFYSASPYPVKVMMRHLFSGVDLVICLSESWRSFFLDNFNCKRIEVLENIVVSPELVPIKTWSEPLKFLFLGRIGDRKGIFDLLAVLTAEKPVFMDKIKLYVGGDGEVEKLKKIIAENDLENIVEYVGWVSGERKIELLKECDVYILPSYNEGLPISILEAMSYGLVVASTNVGGIPEVIKNGHNGYLFEAGDRAQIFKTLQHIINGDSLRAAELRSRSFDIVENYYPEKVIPKLKTFYKSLLIES